MKSLLYILIFLCLSTYNQAQPKSYEISDVIYRYESMLNDPTETFSQISMQDQFFPCVDRLEVLESTLTQADFQLENGKGLVEYYANKDGILKLLGFKSIDPFLSVPDVVIQFFTPIPVVNEKKIENFRTEGISEYFVIYKNRNWPPPLRRWAAENGVTEIRINGSVEWNNKFERKDFFKDIYLDESIGNVIEYNLDYTATKLEVKREKWEEIDLSTEGFLQSLFKPKYHKYYSLYALGSVVETARISITPHRTFSINVEGELGSYADCTHSANDIYVFPNPTFGDINIRFENVDSPFYTFSVYSIIGKKLWTKTLNIPNSKYETFVDLPPLESGVYIYGVDTPNGKRIKSKRLVIMDF